MSPYKGLPARQFWSGAVAPVDRPGSVQDFYSPKFSIDGMKVATAGSCFAQHIARHLKKNGFDVLDKEPPPRGLSGSAAHAFGYHLYSARHGNIYTARRLLQLAQESLGYYKPSDPVWEHKGRFYDALRPTLEPDGLRSPDEVMLHRQQHLRQFRSVLSEADLFVFTFGLTEAWLNNEGQVYSVAPGSPVGQFDKTRHWFKNFDYEEVLKDFLDFRTVVRGINPDIRFLITVSPVPLAATAADSHVLPATVRSKAVLRAVASKLYESCEDVDYFPSYDLLSTPFLGRSMFEQDKRSVSPLGVKSAMSVFLDAHLGRDRGRGIEKSKEQIARRREDVICEEALLDAFAP